MIACLLGRLNVISTPLGPTSPSPNTPKVEKSTPQGVQIRPCETPKSAKRSLGDPKTAPRDQEVEKLGPWLPQVSPTGVPREPREPKKAPPGNFIAGKNEPKPWRVVQNHTSAARCLKIQKKINKNIGGPTRVTWGAQVRPKSPKASKKRCHLAIT